MTREIKFRIWHKELEQMTENVSHKAGWGNPEKVEIMQFTGLKDKNGVEIYEGDIVRHTNGSQGRVAYVAPEFSTFEVGGFTPDELLSEQWEDFSDGGSPAQKAFTVIGNIYENPELLKGTYKMDSLSDFSRKRKEALIKRYGSFEAYKEAAKTWGNHGGSKTAELGKSGFKHLTPEQRTKSGKLGYAAMVKKIEDQIRQEVADEA